MRKLSEVISRFRAAGRREAKARKHDAAADRHAQCKRTYARALALATLRDDAKMQSHWAWHWDDAKHHEAEARKRAATIREGK